MRSIFLLLIFFHSFINAEVYKTIDENGNIIFTDRPSVNSKEIQLKKLKTTETIKPSGSVSNKKNQNENENNFSYKKILISNPKDGSAIRSNTGDVRISVSIEPSLRSGHRILITLDGVELSKGTSTSASASNVDRGTHTVAASVIDSSANPIISISSVFSILRATQ